MQTTEQLTTALAGRYAIERKIGEGGMATVYLAKDLKHDRKVALKVLKPELGAVLGVERFLSEIKVTANLQHPNLLPLFDSGEALGLLFYVMPFVEGESLRARLDREQQLSIDEAVRISSAIASALAYAHERGVIHRDLKPENILLQSGQPVVADFGIALAVSNAGGARVTQTGLSLGTPQYMSPEQATGDRTIDARSDLYSLAAMTYEMIAGEPPHTGPNAQAIMAKLLTADPAPLSSLRTSAPVHVELAIAKALAKVPADRFASAAEFAAALSGEKALTMPIGATRRTAAMPSRPARGGVREVVAWMVAAAAIAAAVWLRPRPEQPRAVIRVGLDLADSIVPRPSQLGGQLSAVAISRDGTLIAYVGGPGGTRSLYVRELAGDTFRQVAGADRVSAPAFSPDGRAIAFLDANNALVRIPASGGVARKLADAASSPMWADDGNIYYTSFGTLFAVSADGGPARVVVASGGDAGLMSQPDVLPGNRAALIQTRKAQSDEWKIGVVDLGSGKLTDLGIAGTNPMFADPGFIVFAPSTGVLAAVKFDPRRLRIAGTPIQLASGIPNSGCDCAVARRTGAVVYRWRLGASAEPTQLALVDRRGVGRVLLDDGRPFDQPRASPDGKRIAVRAGGTAFNTGDVWVYELAGGAMSRLTSDNNSYRASWTRDGAGVLWVTGGGNAPRVWMRPWDGSGPASVLIDSTDVAEYEDGAAGGWSAVRTWKSRDVAILPRDSVRPGLVLPLTRLTSTPANETSVARSPNGAFVAYQSDETGDFEVYIRPVPGPGKRLTVSVGGGSQPRWSPDGKTLYYVSRGRLMAAQLAQGADLAVTHRDSLFELANALVMGDAGGERLYDVMPNGREFVLVRAKGTPTQNPLRTMLLLDWQSLFAAPAEGRTP
jgi:Tol biopolymer transport system component/tRNA A-37 threonylcarbamoyl transferase component Bud32